MKTTSDQVIIHKVLTGLVEEACRKWALTRSQPVNLSDPICRDFIAETIAQRIDVKVPSMLGYEKIVYALSVKS